MLLERHFLNKSLKFLANLMSRSALHGRAGENGFEIRRWMTVIVRKQDPTVDLGQILRLIELRLRFAKVKVCCWLTSSTDVTDEYCLEA